ncbi:hypothetical protein C8N32_10926 [Rhodovulum imhoffii]|uniref:Hpt domain-containing protein n=1 Tax=Rhodovulum imhoffii TaxID=365340 RepID=A0A2T5BRI7_9RHOB|nr:hypothetical protein [Rhodovulum imhoffii]MBK5934017.1 hypothetical protein [Rhodovulum imhoffii]PTN01902.1 hypothetical protein C8N32_10926 [Rhodovulum imhoffii]
MIDWIRVSQLREEVGHDAFEDVVALFMEEIDAVFVALSPNSRLEEDLHFITGSALNLGFDALCRLCREESRKAKARGPGAVNIVALRDCYRASRSAFLDGRATWPGIR